MAFEGLNRTRNIALAAILAAGLALPVAEYAYADNTAADSMDAKAHDKSNKSIANEAVDANAPEKSESVYIFAKADGTVKKTVVTDWLKNATEAAQLHDISSLANIQNTDGDETFEARGESLIWQAQGNDIYYQGTTDKRAPIDLTVTYWLDGTQTPAEQMAGKSGHVKIRFDYKNNSASTEYVAGAARTVYTPFVCVTGMMLDNGVFRNVTTKNAKILNDGDRTMVGGYALPGLQEDLDIDKDTVDFPTSFEVEADVQNFEMGATVTIVSSDLLGSLDTDELDTSELGDALHELSKAMGKLIDGTSQLYDGMGKLDEGGKKLADGAGQLEEKTASLPKNAKKLADGSAKLAGGLGDVVDGVDKLSTGNSLITDGISGAIAGASSIEDGIQKARTVLDNGESEEPDIGDAIAGAKDDVDAAAADISGILEDTPAAESLAALGTYIQDAQSEVGDAGQNMTSAKDDVSAAAGQLDAVMKSDGYASLPADQQEAIQSAFNSLAGEDGAEADLDAASVNVKTIGEKLEAAGSARTATANSLGTIATNLQDISSTLDGAGKGIESVVAGLDQLLVGTGDLTSGLDQLKGGSTDLGTGISTLGDGLAGATEGAGQLADGLGALSKAVPSLSAGIKALAEGADGLSEGIGAAKDGTGKLKEGIQQLNDEGIQKIVDAYHDNLDGLSDRLKATVNAGKAYNTFTGKSDDMQGSVKFIYETEAIEIDEDKK